MRRFDPGRDLEQAAMFDGVTGLYGKAAFDTIGGELVEQARRYGFHLSVALFRMDLPHGAETLDPDVVAEAAHYVGLLLVENLRQSDIAAHLGNGIFAVLMPHTPVETARQVTQRMRATLVKSPVLLRSGDQMAVGASTGIATYEKGFYALNDLLAVARADVGIVENPPQQRVSATES